MALSYSRKPELLADLASAGLTEVAISLDGLNDDIFLKTRGVPMFDTKVKAIDASINAGLSITVSATLVPGVNVDQIGGIIEFAKKRHWMVSTLHPLHSWEGIRRSS